MKKILLTLLCISIGSFCSYCKATSNDEMGIYYIYYDKPTSAEEITEEFMKTKQEITSVDDIQESEPLTPPQMTSQMSIKEKQKGLQKYMSDCGYNNYNIETLTDYIDWDKITDDFAPSFYKVLQYGYLRKYIHIDVLSKYCTNEEIIIKINNLIEKMLSYNYEEDCIHGLIYNIDWDKVPDDFTPSFYKTLQNGYIRKYIPTDIISKYCTNEEVITNINNFIEKMLSYDYEEDCIYSLVYNIDWDKVPDDFTPSFYKTLQNGYIRKYIPTDIISKYCTNEEVITNINNFIEKMLSYDYEEHYIYRLVYNIDWDKITDDFAPSFYKTLQNGYINKYIPIDIATAYCTNEEMIAKMNNLIDKMITYNYSDSDIKKLFILVRKQKESEDFAPSFYTAIEKGYLFKYISLQNSIKYSSDEKYMLVINDLTDIMKSENYSDEDITLRIDYLYLIKNKIEKNTDLTTEQLLKKLNSKNIVQYKTLRRIANWHDNNIFHEKSGFGNFTTAQALCLFSCYGGITAFIVPPVILVSYIITEIAYIPVGIITKF